MLPKNLQDPYALPLLMKVFLALLGNFERRPKNLGILPSGKFAHWPLKLREEFSLPPWVMLSFLLFWKLLPPLLTTCGMARIQKLVLAQLKFPHLLL